MNEPIIYSQYIPEKKETAYSINYTYISKNLKYIPCSMKPDEDNTLSYINIYEKYEDNIMNETPGLFIFLLDISGSMSGEALFLAKNALLLFIQSLPKESYFQIIGFYQYYKHYNEKPVKYNEENIYNIRETINLLSAQTYETNLYPPLLEILNQDYSEINFSKNIFILTDGYIKDNDKCINLIKNNLNGFRIHSIGLGNDVDKIFIEQCAKLGKGSSSFIKGIKDVNSVVINALSKASRPYITNIKFEFENYKNEIASSIIKCNPINNFAYQNEVMNYSFILPGNKEITDLKIRLTGKDPINQIEIRNTLEKMIKLENGDEMSKMIVGIALKNNENLISKDEKKKLILQKNIKFYQKIHNFLQKY